MKFPKVQKGIFNPMSDNVKKLAELFPSVVKDGQVDFAALYEELGEFEAVSDELSERYELGWAGKAEAKRLARTDLLGKTLKYIPEESKDTDTTENLYIEGDNLEVLKLLRNSYYNKIKMIYIDPPYNTGNDFIYKDNFAISEVENAFAEGEIDELGERLIVNQKSSGKYHSNWLSMMYPRLRVAKDLLAEEGVIFISIDDNEVANLRKICDEIFGERNFIGNIVWQKKQSPQNDATNFSDMHDHIIVFAKRAKESKNDDQGWQRNLLPRTDEQEKRYQNPDNDIRGPWTSVDLTSNKTSVERPNLYYPIINPYTNQEVWPSTQRVWRYEKTTMKNLLAEQRIWWGTDGSNFPRQKRFLKEVQKGLVPSTWWEREFASDNQAARRELRAIFEEGEADFNTPKPTLLVKRMLQIATNRDCKEIVLDFFSGSATTAHAVMQLNAEDGGNRKFIMVQIPEPCDEKSEAYKAGFETISEIGKERIRRAGEKIKQENKDRDGIENLDIGFKVFRVANTNIRWFSDAIMSDQVTIDESMLLDKDLLDFNPGYTDIDVVYEILLRHRDIPLTAKVDRLANIGERTYMFAGTVVVSLDGQITNEMIDQIGAIEPMPTKIIFRDSAFGDDISLKTNTMLRLEAQIKKNSGLAKKTYRVEFI
jgi:adenine-specific DNA-methyltransferase